MRRRDFIAGLGGAAVASSAIWPLAARAQQPAIPVIGFLHSSSAAAFAPMVAGFRRGLNEVGYVEGQNLAIEFRWAENQLDRLPALAADLVGRRVSVIAAPGGPQVGLAVKAATANIPFVFTTATDPVKLGLVVSLNRPGGNATGVNMLSAATEAKRLGLLHQLIPVAARIAVIVNPVSPEAGVQLSDLQAAARIIGTQLYILRAGTESEIEAVFATLAQAGVQALLVTADPFLNGQRERIVALAARHSMPAIYEARTFADDGGLMSYGPNIPDVYRQIGIYTGQILKGVKPADLPVIQPTAFELVINLKTAKALGLDIPPMLLALADGVIE
jgi:putative ABC transport system substrate-binding protein